MESEHKQKKTTALFDEQVEGWYQKVMENEVLATARTVNSDTLVKFRIDECPTFGIQLKRRDRLLLFIDKRQSQENALFASHARFIATQNLTTAELNSYLSCLMNEKISESLEGVKIIEQCPAPWQFILDFIDLPQDGVLSVLNVSNALVKSSVTKDASTYKQFFHQFLGRAFIPGPLTAVLRNIIAGYSNEGLESNKIQSESTAHQLIESCKCFAESIASYAPKVLPAVLPLIQLLVDHKIPACDTFFLMSLLKLAVSHTDDPVNTHWSKLQLLITSSELQCAERAINEETESAIAKGFLPCVRTHGPYPNVDSYMDTYMRLLREDRMSSVRNALVALKRGALDSEELRNVPILPYIKTIAIQMIQASKCLAVVVQTENSNISKSMIRHATNKLMHGNLVAFIVDGNFDDILYATVATTFKSSDSAVQFSVVFGSGPTLHSRSNEVDGLTRLFHANDTLAVVSPVYYHAFKPVMVSLQRQTQDFLPFKEEFVFLNFEEPTNHAEKPEEMLNETAVNLTDVIKDDIQQLDLREEEKLEMMESTTFSNSDSSEYSIQMSPLSTESLSEDELYTSMQQVCKLKKSSKYKHSRLPSYLRSGNITMSWQGVFQMSLKNPDTPDPGYWKSSEKVDFETLRKTYKSLLDDSQLDAVELALHNRVAIIQGPPGTGKTLIGFRLAQLLLSVSSLPDGPILVLSYKNHALNEFLAGCCTFCSDNEVVRVGGQKEKLRNTNVRRLKDICPRPRLPRVPDEFSRMKRVIELVPLFVEFMPVNELQNMATIKDHACRLTFSQFDNDDLRQNLMHVVNTNPAVYRTVCSLKGIAEDECPFAKIVQALHKVLASWIPDEKSLEVLLTTCGVQSLDQKPISRLSATYLMKQQKSTQDDIEDIEYELTMELTERGLDPIHGVEKEYMSNVVPLSGTPPVSSEKNKEIIFAVDLARVKPSKLTTTDLYHTLSLIRLKRNMKRDDLAHVIKILAQLKWKTSIKALSRKTKELSQAFAEVEEQHICDSANMLKKVKIVGMTTDGAAINHKLLSQLKPAIVIIEEAAEILEVQVLAVLSAAAQHLILIGDHKQLRPPVENYELQQKNKFDVSLLERLVNNNHPHVSLTHQGRMLPVFIPLLEPIYNDLQTNSEAIKNNQPAACFTKPMYFWSHAYPETRIGTSFCNKDEANMLFNMILWCILQNEQHRIHPSKITVIAMYAAQVKFIRKLVKDFQDNHIDLANQLLDSGQTRRRNGKKQKRSEETDEFSRPLIRVCTVDQYQGDENEYIFVSLVRSNVDGAIGHVRIQNRMCVSCSRSRSGLYVFGNADCLHKAKNNAHWHHALKYFKEQDCLGNSVPLRCPRHPSVTFKVSQPKDLKIQHHNQRVFLPTSCKEQCGQLMKCGEHRCLELCHPHLGDEKCMVLVNVVLSCGHPHTCHCWQSTVPLQWNFRCEKQCERTINCPRQHQCPRTCGERCPTFSECKICERLELDRRHREAQRKEAVAKKIQKAIATEKEQLQGDERHCSVTLLEQADDLELQFKIKTVENIVFSCKGESDNSTQNSELKLVCCWEITNLTQVRKFVNVHQRMLKQRRRHQAHFQHPYMALVVPRTCDDVNQFIRSVADHGVMVRNTSFGLGIFLTRSPGHSCFLDGTGPYEKSSTLTDQPLLTLIICQVALGRRINKQPKSTDLMALSGDISEWGHWPVRTPQRSHNESGSEGHDVVQVVATDQVLPAYIACCKRVEVGVSMLHYCCSSCYCVHW